MNKKETFFKRHKNKLTVFCVFSVCIFCFANYIGFKHIPGHIHDLWRDIVYKFTTEERDNDQIIPKDNDKHSFKNSPDTIVVLQPPKYPLDSLLYIHDGEVEDDFKEELEELRKVDFSKLKVAEDFPTDTECQYAIVRHYGAPVIKLLKKYEASLKIGKCYVAPLLNTDPDRVEIARVTCMVSGFNRKNENLSNIEMPLRIAYDFVRYSFDPENWYVENLSQRIPFDYELNPHKNDID
ncbi:hypothetical protein BSF41_11880 [Flavobacterium sp. ACN2]|jgi:hypothetical protein|uniref:hypothetical protein n=1 Tax=Flavobacterium sp. ACN2 TaxID=1975676 RepID=UPI000BB2E2EA|nr:hypothetical protein [Flavobacterium sp. ACN2]PBI91586.1 hypothetical protein BSF41_11880 [Flavobacterium sp. ACN2]